MPNDEDPEPFLNMLTVPRAVSVDPSAEIVVAPIEKVRLGHDPRSDETLPSTSTGSGGAGLGGAGLGGGGGRVAVRGSVVPGPVVPGSVVPGPVAGRGSVAATGPARELENRMPAASRMIGLVGNHDGALTCGAAVCRDRETDDTRAARRRATGHTDPRLERASGPGTVRHRRHLDPDHSAAGVNFGMRIVEMKCAGGAFLRQFEARRFDSHRATAGFRRVVRGDSEGKTGLALAAGPFKHKPRRVGTHRPSAVTRAGHRDAAGAAGVRERAGGGDCRHLALRRTRRRRRSGCGGAARNKKDEAGERGDGRSHAAPKANGLPVGTTSTVRTWAVRAKTDAPTRRRRPSRFLTSGPLRTVRPLSGLRRLGQRSGVTYRRLYGQDRRGCAVCVPLHSSNAALA